MTHSLIRVAVIDDDFMIANLHGKFIASQPGYQLVGSANNFEQSIKMIKQNKPDLLLLDVYLPDKSGIELLRELRVENIPCDVILITASKELDIVQDSFRLGIFDYLIKPFDLDHLKHSIEKYAQFKSRFGQVTKLDQGTVDDLKKLRSLSNMKPISSGIDFRTLDRIKHFLSLSHGPHSAEEIAKLAGVSRSTARTYLAYLVEEHLAEEELVYGAVGRPQRVFRLK